MYMPKNNFKVFIHTLLIFACVSFQRCTDQESIAPRVKEEVELTEVDVLRNIKSLGFADSQIKEMPGYYLADGDLYFPKKMSGSAASPVKKAKHRIAGKYGNVTIRLDKSLANEIDDRWRAGIEQAVAEWNADEDVHFHFAFTNSASANIAIIKDTELPEDLPIASEFPRNGRPGATIRINVAATKVVKDPKPAFAHALEHCVGILHSTSAKNKGVEMNSHAPKTARGPRFDIELYIIQYDILHRVNGETGEYYTLKKGWSETEVMGELDGTLYMVQFGTLYAVNPSTGNHTTLTEGWEGSQFMTSIAGGKLYIMQNSEIYPVDPTSGDWDKSIGYYSLGRGLAGFLDDSDNKYKLGVLKRKSGSSTVSLLYIIKPSNGSEYSGTRIPASNMDDWNGNFFLASNYRLNIFNGTENWVDDDGQYQSSHGDFPHVEVVSSCNPSKYVYHISAGTLYRRVINRGYWVERLGKKGDWVNTSCMVYLKQ